MTTTTTPATTPDRFPRYCVECGEGMRTGYQHEEDTSLCYCSLDCAADGLEMTVEELEDAYDNAVDGRQGKHQSREALVTFEEWMDSPHEDYEAYEAGKGAYHPPAEEARRYQRLYDTSTLQAHYTLTTLPWLKKVIAGILVERGIRVMGGK
jgi:hypothetical protein